MPIDSVAPVAVPNLGYSLFRLSLSLSSRYDVLLVERIPIAIFVNLIASSKSPYRINQHQLVSSLSFSSALSETHSNLLPLNPTIGGTSLILQFVKLAFSLRCSWISGFCNTGIQWTTRQYARSLCMLHCFITNILSVDRLYVLSSSFLHTNTVSNHLTNCLHKLLLADNNG